MTPQEPITTRCIHCHQPLPLNPTTIINHLHQHRTTKR